MGGSDWREVNTPEKITKPARRIPLGVGWYSFICRDIGKPTAEERYVYIVHTGNRVEGEKHIHISRLHAIFGYSTQLVSPMTLLR